MVAHSMVRHLGLAALIAFASPAVARPYDEVVKDGTLRVALYDENAPFSDNKDGKPQGIDVDVAQALADRLKVKLDLRLVDAGENVDGDFRLNLWRGDLVGSQLADLMLHVPIDRILQIRNEQIFMTRPYYDQRIAFAWRKSAIEGLEAATDIGDSKIAVEGNSSPDAMMLTAEGGRFRPNLVHFKNFDEAAKAFIAGEAPILAGTRAGIEAALSQAKISKVEVAVAEIRLGGPVKTSWEIGGAVKTDSRDLAYAINDAITAMTEDGTLKGIFEKHGTTFSAPKGY